MLTCYGCSEMRFARCEAEAFPQLMATHNVGAVPTFLFFADRRRVGCLEGADAAALTGKVRWLRGASEEELVEAACADLVVSAPVVLVMKGSPDAPKCGFSKQLVALLRGSGVTFTHFDVLKDSVMREALKKHANWPTYPQLYGAGRLLGGLDIARELADSGTLIEELSRGEDVPEDDVKEKDSSDVDPAKAAARSAEDVEGATVAAALTGEQAVEASAVPASAPSVGADGLDDALRTRLQGLTAQQPVMLFMKGNPETPRCGFSRKIVALLNENAVRYSTFDILEDNDVRQGLKKLSDWPTFPQLYSNGNLVGGLDIVQELVASDALQEELSVERNAS